MECLELMDLYVREFLCTCLNVFPATIGASSYVLKWILKARSLSKMRCKDIPFLASSRTLPVLSPDEHGHQSMDAENINSFRNEQMSV